MKIVARPIDAIVVFKGNGHPLPYRFKFTAENGEKTEISVEKILLVEEQRVAGKPSLVYDCQSRIGSCQRRYQLKYMIPDCRWVLYKI